MRTLMDYVTKLRTGGGGVGQKSMNVLYGWPLNINLVRVRGVREGGGGFRQMLSGRVRIQLDLIFFSSTKLHFIRTD